MRNHRHYAVRLLLQWSNAAATWLRRGAPALLLSVTGWHRKHAIRALSSREKLEAAGAGRASFLIDGFPRR